jgi:DNA polymerase-1
MFNRLIQGSSADLMKKAMVEAYKAGIFNVLHPHLTVHDEMDVSVPRTKEGHDALRELKYTMENCVKLKVPILADVEIGPNWGEVKEWDGK